MEPLEAIQLVFSLAKAVKAKLDQVQANKERCQMLNRLIESLLRPIERLQGKAESNEDLRYFTEEMRKILIETKELFEKLSVREGLLNKVKRVWKADSDEGKIDLIRQRLMDLNHNATYLTLIRLYENDHIQKANKESSWDVKFDYVCLFCYVTPEELVIIGGSYEETETDYHLKAYDQNKNEMWHWQCTPEMGQPSDVASVTIEGEDYLAIVCEGSGTIVLFNLIDHSPQEVPAYTIGDPGKERLRRIAHYDSHRLVVSVDPTWSAADEGKSSELRVLNCNSTSFSVIRCIEIKNIIDTHALTFLSRANLAVVCGRHNNRIYVFDINEGHSKWHLHPQMIGESEVVPEGVCSIAGDLCVMDSSETRLVVATKNQWKDELVEPRELGDQVYGLTWDKSTKRIIVLHEIKGRRRITMFNVET